MFGLSSEYEPDGYCECCFAPDPTQEYSVDYQDTEGKVVTIIYLFCSEICIEQYRAERG